MYTYLKIFIDVPFKSNQTAFYAFQKY